MDLFTLSFNILGALISFGFIYITIVSSRSLIGSFFKQYYRLMIVAAIFFGLGFLLEIFGGVAGLSVDTEDVIHHILLIGAGIMFVYTGIIFPKEAAKLAGPPATL
ncbi:hypothetical protein HZB05_01595 [Candidatus Wolfebacteria bacterium]|nr:hypothetical protein [Candidatus Wolfebacteria bacterium]